MSQRQLSEKAFALKEENQRASGRRCADPVLTITEVCQELGISIWTWQRRVRPHVTVVELSRKLRGVRRSELDRFIESRSIPAAVRPLEEAAPQ
jgi:hypothetical protein